MEHTHHSASALVAQAIGPLKTHVAAFVTTLIDQGYSASNVYHHARRVLDFDRWLQREGIGIASVDEALIDAYRRDRLKHPGRCKAWRNELAALRGLLAFLCEQGACPRATSKSEPVERLVGAFEQHLVTLKGLAPLTIAYYIQVAREFLIGRFGDGEINLASLDAKDLIEFVRSRAGRMKPPVLKMKITSLRSFLRFAQYMGAVPAELVSAVPAVASWSTTPALPRAIAVDHARCAIDGCDQTTAVGRRDRAVLLLLARLGLRGCEVLRLRLDDIDWEHGTLLVRGKGGSRATMPLPDDVGKAIAAYLTTGRPVCSDRHVFLRARAPVRALMQESDGIGSIVRHALMRAGVQTPRKGAHQFRHALAVRLLNDGASLREIGEMLRHRSPQVTTLYARVDVTALRNLAMPWPGGAR